MTPAWLTTAKRVLEIVLTGKREEPRVEEAGLVNPSHNVKYYSRLDDEAQS